MSDKRIIVVYGVVAAALGIGAFWFATRVRMEREERREFVNRYRNMISATHGSHLDGAVEQSESEEEKQATVKVLFGSESGNAEALAKGLVQMLQDHGVPSVLIDPSEWGCLDRYLMSGGSRQGSKRSAVPLFAATRGDSAKPVIYVFVTATTGEGLAPANMMTLQAEMTAAVEQFTSTGAAAGPFNGVPYAVFALGDTSYKYFCKCGTAVNTLLRKGGGTEVYKIGFGDAKKKRQEDEFDDWSEHLLAALTTKCGVVVTSGSGAPPAPQLELHFVSPASGAQPNGSSAAAAATSTTSSSAVVSSSPFPLPPALMEPSLAFPAPMKILAKEAVTAVRESDGSYVMRVTMSTLYQPRARPTRASASNRGAASVTGGASAAAASSASAAASTALQYQAGDHFGILACNPPETVSRFTELLALSEQQLRTPVELSRCPPPHAGPPRVPPYNTLPACVPLRTVLERYVDLCGRPRRAALRVLAKYCTVPSERDAFLALLRPVAPTDEEAVAAKAVATASLRTTLDYMEAFPSCATAIPLGHLLELLGRLQPRYYSIASDPLSHGDTLEIYLRVVADGLVSQYLSHRVETGDFVFAFVRPSTFHLPASIADGRPVIMIGPGTGVAAMVGLNYRREAVMWRKPQGRYGPCLFYFGAQHRASEYFVKEELERWAASPAELDALDAAHPGSHAGLAARRQRPKARAHLPVPVIANLQLAFSRDQEEKCYVTHLMDAQLDVLHEYLTNTTGGGCLVYVSGDAAAMAKEVDRILAKALQEKGGMSRLAALEFLRNMEQERRLLKDVY